MTLLSSHIIAIPKLELEVICTGINISFVLDKSFSHLISDIREQTGLLEERTCLTGTFSIFHFFTDGEREKEKNISSVFKKASLR